MATAEPREVQSWEELQEKRNGWVSLEKKTKKSKQNSEGSGALLQLLLSSM